MARMHLWVRRVSCEHECCRDLHAHVTQTAEADHANLLALARAPAAQRGMGCSSRTKQRGRASEVQVAGHLEAQRFSTLLTLGRQS